MADGTARKEFGGTRIGKVSTGLGSSDADKLRAIREGISVTLSAQVDIANRIHDVELRDAALGNLVKRHTRSVLGSPARMTGLKYEIEVLRNIADMMSAETKRLGMFAYIERATSPKN